MDHPVVDENVLAELRTLDTPTVCNALEAIAPERRGYGYTTKTLFCLRPSAEPMVGYARTATIRAMRPTSRSGAESGQVSRAYYDYMYDGPKPTIVVVQDLDGEQRGYGSWWGEYNTNVHKGLGSIGVITDGSIRDLPDFAEGFQALAGLVCPSHAFVHVESFASDVNIFGMVVRHGDLIHADLHGAVVVPVEVAAEIKQTADAQLRGEQIVIQAAKQPGFNPEKLREAQKSQFESY